MGQLLADLDTGSIIRHLRQSGLVLLRGFDINLANFEAITVRFCDRFHNIGTRRSLETSGSDGYTSEVSRKNFNLFSHSEGAYRPWPPPPELCFFNCVQPPGSTGGETMLVDGVDFLEKLPGGLRERFDQQGIIYEARWDKERWHTEFAVNCPEELHALLIDHPQCEYQFDGDAIQVRCHVAAIQTSLGGVPAFANGLLAHLPQISHPRWRGVSVYSKCTNRVFFGDGEEIQEAVIHGLIDIQDEIALNHGWMIDDLLIFDNTRFMHGRRKITNIGERKIGTHFGFVRFALPDPEEGANPIWRRAGFRPEGNNSLT